MKILIRNSDNIVIYAQSDLLLDTEAHGDNWRDPNFNTINATLADAILPLNWTGGVWTYIDNLWAIADSVRYEAMLADVSDRKAAEVRAERNTMLSKSDWTQITDATADKTTWATYRQALRDVTKQAGFPWTITWPNDPNWVDRTI